jgi:pimeloyl-ACP methyl ester carboxylesterase
MAQNIPHAQLHIFEQASHIIHTDASEEFFQVIRTSLGVSLKQELPSLPS